MTPIYMKIDGIDGEAKDSSHQDWIDVESWSFGVSQPGAKFRSGGGSGTPRGTDFTVAKHLDKATPKLMQFCADGTHFPKVNIDLTHRSPDGGDRFMKIELTDCFITSYSTSPPPDEVRSGDADDLPAESISLNFTKIEWTYHLQEPDGTTSTTHGQWDLKAPR